MYKCRIVEELQGTWPALVVVDAVTLLCCYKSSLFSRADSLWLVMSTTDREPLQQHWPNTGYIPYISLNLDLGIDIYLLVPCSFSFQYIVGMCVCLCCITADNPVMVWQIYLFSRLWRQMWLLSAIMCGMIQANCDLCIGHNMSTH